MRQKSIPVWVMLLAIAAEIAGIFGCLYLIWRNIKHIVSHTLGTS